ncbi:MAG TPA: nucleotide exchange factor GrpE [Marinagarivorans sp.]
MSQDPSQTQDNEAEALEDDQVELSSVESTDEGASDVAALQAEVEALKNELAGAQEQVLRASAEMQNARRRAQQDVEKAHKFALEKFVGDMLPVADNLERALEAANGQQGSIEAIVEGVELTLKSMVDGLKRHNVEGVYPEGEPFDPQLHQAMSMVPDPNVEPNTVINVFQRGYTLNGRLVRPAMVVVSKGE